MRLLRAFVLLLGAFVATCFAACSPQLPRAADVVTWAEPASSARVESANATELVVTPGTLVRFSATTPLTVGEVTRTREGEATLYRTYAPERDAVIVRPGLLTTALRAAPSVLARAHVGQAADPEIAWFDIETDALAWARTPLGTPFPRWGGPANADPTLALSVDRVLEGDPEATRAPELTSAIRSVVALRLVRTLQGLRGYPYAENEDVALSAHGATRTFSDRDFTDLGAARRANLRVSGPAQLFVWARAKRGAIDGTSTVAIHEAGRLRAESRAAVRAEHDDPADDTALLARLAVFVPPGPHDYAVSIAGPEAFVAARVSRAVVRAADALSGDKNEASLIDTMRASCSARGKSDACLLAAALSHDDGTPRYSHRQTDATAAARALAARITGGSAFDAAAHLEHEATLFPDASVRELGQRAASSIDAHTRDAWKRATLRETKWSVVEEGERSWHAFVAADPSGPGCVDAARVAGGATSATEVGASEVVLPATPWRHLHVIRLLAVAPCEAKQPIELEVDGEKLSAQPSGPRAEWRIAVRGETANVHRVDTGPGRVLVLTSDVCSAHTARIAAPHTLGSEPASLAYPTDVRAPGVDVWVREGTTAERIEIVARDGGEKLSANVRPAAGVIAIDDRGERWTRAARIALPARFAGGVEIRGSASVAVIASARGALHEDAVVVRAPARTPDPAALVALSRALLAAASTVDRAGLYLARARALASFGATRAALEDAERARRLGKGDALETVAAEILPLTPTPTPLTQIAYGLDGDFDPGVARCVLRATPRSQLSALDDELVARAAALSARPQAIATMLYDAKLAARAIPAVLRARQDPRAESVLLHALTGSRWRALITVEGAPRISAPVDPERNPILEPDGRLRPRIEAGDPFGTDFATVTAEHPAHASLAGLGAKQGRAEVVCVVRGGAIPCPMRVLQGGVKVPVTFDAAGHASIPLGGKGGLDFTMPPDVDAFGLVRISLDSEVAGAVNVPGVGWVLRAPHLQARFAVDGGHAARVHMNALDVLRVEAFAADTASTELVAEVNGEEATRRARPAERGHATRKQFGLARPPLCCELSRHVRGDIGCAERRDTQRRPGAGRGRARGTAACHRRHHGRAEHQGQWARLRVPLGEPRYHDATRGTFAHRARERTRSHPE